MGEIDFILDGLRHNLDTLSVLHKGGTATRTTANYHLDKHKELTERLEAAMKAKYK